MRKFGAFLVGATFFLLITAETVTAQGPVPLGAAASFAALAGSGMTNTGPTTITGDVGSFPTPTQTGFIGLVTLSGTNHFGDAVTQAAKTDLRIAFLDAAGRPSPTPVLGGALGGRTLTPGVYKDDGAPASLGLTGTLTLDALGDPNAVFIFQSASTLITEVGASVVLQNGAQACNVFWQVGSAATLKTSTIFVGTIMAHDDITVGTGAAVAGRLLAGAQANGAGALTLINNTIAVLDCAAPPAAADLTISKSHSGNFVQGQAGATFSLAASNVGLGSTVGTVTVSDTLPAGLTATAIGGTGWDCTLSTLTCTRSDALAAGASYSSITLTVNVAGDAPAAVINTAAVSGGGELNLNNNSAGDTATIAQTPILVPDLTISKSHSGDFEQGGTGSYTLTASNVGPGPAAGTVTVSDTLPAGLTATGASGTGWSCTLPTPTCTRSDALAAGASYPPITVTVNVAGNAPATVINTATVSGGSELNLSNDSASDTTTITPQIPDLTITKSHSGDFKQGGTGSYTLTVSNVGPGPTDGTVTVSEMLPAGLTATGASGTGWYCTLPTATCTRSDALAAGGAYPPITVTVNVANDPLICSQVGDNLTFQPGDILISMRDGTVQWRRPDWTLVKTIPSVTDGQAKGMAFDASGKLFVTHFFGTDLSGNDVEKFDRNGKLIGSFGSDYDCNPSSIVFDETGNAYVGHADCSAGIFKLDPDGNRLARYDVAVENRGASHILLDPDQCTMYYTSQGPNVKRFNVCTNEQMSDFNRAPLPDAIDGAQQLVRVPGGGLLVANSSVIVRLDASGNLIRTYNAPADTHCWLGAALDPAGTSFWATDWCGSSATRFDMMSGSVIESHTAADLGFMVKQIIIVPPLPGRCSAVVINKAEVSGGGEEYTGNNSADDSTTIFSQPLTSLLTMDSAAYCVGTAWSLGVSDAPPEASVRLIGTTNGQPWVMEGLGTTDVNGMFSLRGVFAEGSIGNFTLKVETDAKLSNTVSLVISKCQP